MKSDPIYIRKQFLSALQCGTGKAYLILKDHPDIDFSDLIIKGAVTNFAYDRQCEGSRADYIYRLINEVQQKDSIVKTVLKRLIAKKSDYYNLTQICDLAVLLFKAGYAEAGTALHKRFEKNNLPDYQFCGQDQLIEMDGMAGLLKVAEIVGKELYADKDDREYSWRVDAFQKKNKGIAVYEALQKAAKKNKYINAYYKSVLQNQQPDHTYKGFTKFSYSLIKEKMAANKFRVITIDRANDLSGAEVENLANDFLQEKDQQKQELYLRFFAKRKFPFDYQPILKMAGGRNPAKTRLVEYAVEALTWFSARDIRQLALKKLTAAKNPGIYLNLLVSNYEKGDDRLLVEIAGRSDNYDYIHSLVAGFIDIYTANKTTESKTPLETLYRKMNCGLHRRDVVELLIENEVLSDRIYQELPYDSDADVRDMYRQLQKKRN